MEIHTLSARFLGSAFAVAAAPDQEQAMDPAEAAAVKKLEAAGASVRPIAQNDKHLEVSFLGYGTQIGPEAKNAPPPDIDRDLSPIQNVKDAIYVRLGRTPVTDKGLAHLAGLTGLTKLNLEETKITDAGLANLKNLQALEYLNLYGTGVTDAGLEQLKSLKGLKRLYLWQTKVTEAGVQKLKAALPQAEINWQRDGG